MQRGQIYCPYHIDAFLLKDNLYRRFAKNEERDSQKVQNQTSYRSVDEFCAHKKVFMSVNSNIVSSL